MIEVSHLKKVYGEGDAQTAALLDVSFSIREGEFVAIMGPSGSGKSTLLHIMSYLDRPSTGEYRFLGKRMDELSDFELARARNEKMGFVFQAFYLLPRVNVLENVMLPLVYSGIALHERSTLAQKAIDAVGLSHRTRHLATQLSGGEKQRVAIARAIATNPAMVFADEPTGNLDSKSGLAIMHILQELNEQGRTIVMVTHETYTAEHARRILRMKDGMLVGDENVTKRRHAEDGNSELK